MVRVAPGMCSDLSGCSTRQCAFEPRVNYRHLIGIRCLTHTIPIQNPITFVFWQFSTIFKAFQTQWDLQEPLSRLDVVMKVKSLTLYRCSVVDVHPTTSVPCTFSIGNKFNQGSRYLEQLSAGLSWRKAYCPGHLYYSCTQGCWVVPFMRTL